MRIVPMILALLLVPAACGRLDEVGRAPGFTPFEGSPQHSSIYAAPAETGRPATNSSLWSSGREALFGDRRAARRGDILTVVIEIDDKAEISNTSGRSRSGEIEMGISELLGFLIFLPFLVIDLVVAAILMSMGMMMVPPAVVALPFKLAFFVVADGWALLSGALVRSYV